MSFEESQYQLRRDKLKEIEALGQESYPHRFAATHSLAEILTVADGVIVGTSLKVDGVTWSKVDPARAGRLMETARAIRSRSS